MEDKEDERVVSIMKAITCSSKKKDNVGSSKEDIIIIAEYPFSHFQSSIIKCFLYFRFYEFYY
jgi:hypothetical protein